MKGSALKKRAQRLKSNFPYFARNCLKIRTKSGKVTPFSLNRAQEYVLKSCIEQMKDTGKIRVVILKARQQGISTLIEGRIFWKTVLNQGLKAFIMAHEREATDNLFSMSRRFYEHLPAPLRPGLQASNAKELVFEGTDSGYQLGTAGNQAAGRSNTIQLFHGSEVAFWPNAAEVLSGALQAVPDLPGTEVFLESTANGMGGIFHEYVKDAEAGRGDYKLIFIPWFWEHTYRKKAPASFVPDEKERELQKRFDLDPDQLFWRRTKIHELKSADIFRQEYPSTVAEAFLFSGRGRFDPAHLEAAREECFSPAHRWTLTATAIDRKQEGNLLIWDLPDPKRLYSIGADVSEGLVHGDRSCIDVCDEEGRQVAHWNGKVEPDELGSMLKVLGRFYRNALIGVERNNHGLTTLVALKDYPNLFMETTKDERAERFTRKAGWLTTTRTKPLMIDHVATILRDSHAGIRSAGICHLETVREMQTYVIGDNGQTHATPGCFDDRVMSYALARQMVLAHGRPIHIPAGERFHPAGKAGY